MKERKKERVLSSVCYFLAQEKGKNVSSLLFATRYVVNEVRDE